jgi:serine/threonine protein phosphatase PrpC
MMNNKLKEYNWIGSQNDFVDTISIVPVNHISLGRFGGNSLAGQYKNEDGCIIWADEQHDWEFAVLMDAHQSADSAELVVHQIYKYKRDIQEILSLSFELSLQKIEGKILTIFQEEEFLSSCRKVDGETACLLVLRKDKYLWWFSVGDCISYLFHPELAGLGQYQVNQRHFFEWIGRVNTFEQTVPCFSSGMRELRKGMNRIMLTTDGLVECPNDPFSSAEKIYEAIKNQPLNKGIKVLLEVIKENHVRDSTTIIAWDVNIVEEVSIPSDA